MSGGRKQAPRPVRAEFWERMRSGVSPRDAGVAMGMRKGAERWFALAGGVKSNGPGSVSGRYLSLAEREEIAIGVARGESYRVIRGADRAPGVDHQPGGAAERAAAGVPGAAGAGTGGGAGAAAEGGKARGQ
jgi:hypothetical protein